MIRITFVWRDLLHGPYFSRSSFHFAFGLGPFRFSVILPDEEGRL